MASPNPLTIPQVLRLVRYEMRLSLRDMAARVGMPADRYLAIEAGQRGLTESGWQSLFLHMPIVEAIVRRRPLGKTGALSAQALCARATQLEGMTPAQRDVELARIRLELAWLDEQAST
jgi:transcriptional regulator with XRE-family HTH domain